MVSGRVQCERTVNPSRTCSPSPQTSFEFITHVPVLMLVYGFGTRSRRSPDCFRRPRSFLTAAFFLHFFFLIPSSFRNSVDDLIRPRNDTINHARVRITYKSAVFFPFFTFYVIRPGVRRFARRKSIMEIVILRNGFSVLPFVYVQPFRPPPDPPDPPKSRFVVYVCPVPNAASYRRHSAAVFELTNV